MKNNVLIQSNNYIIEVLGGSLICAVEKSDIIILYVKLEQLYKVLKFLKGNLNLTELINITAVDYPEREYRFEVVYNLLSVVTGSRVIVKVVVSEEQKVESIVPLYKGAEWYEREAYDMFGIIFENLKDCRRILSDYGFEGHPLRKDFPLSGYKEYRYDEKEKKVVDEPIELAENFRGFEYKNPWLSK